METKAETAKTWLVSALHEVVRGKVNLDIAALVGSSIKRWLVPAATHQAITTDWATELLGWDCLSVSASFSVVSSTP